VTDFWKKDEGPQLKPFDGPHLCGFECWDPTKGSLVLVCSDGKRAYVIEYIGGAIDYVMSEYPDPYDEFEGIDAGVWVAKVSVQGHRDYWGEYDEEVSVDELRALTGEEWELLQGGDTVLDDTGWRLCEGEETE
jgi:hypothetical protein